MNFRERTYLWYVVLLRLWIGYYFLQQGIRKFLGDFPHGNWTTRQIGELDKINIYPWYKAFLANAVFPFHELFGYLVMSGEILVGLCLLLGLLTRFSSLVGLFLVLNYYLAIGMARGGATLAQQQTFSVCLIVLFLSNSGKTLGLDAWLLRKR